MGWQEAHEGPKEQAEGLHLVQDAAWAGLRAGGWLPGRQMPRKGLLGEPQVNMAQPAPVQQSGSPGAVLVPVVPAGAGG